MESGVRDCKCSHMSQRVSPLKHVKGNKSPDKLVNKFENLAYVIPAKIGANIYIYCYSYLIMDNDKSLLIKIVNTAKCAHKIILNKYKTPHSIFSTVLYSLLSHTHTHPHTRYLVTLFLHHIIVVYYNWHALHIILITLFLYIILLTIQK